MTRTTARNRWAMTAAATAAALLLTSMPSFAADSVDAGSDQVAAADSPADPAATQPGAPQDSGPTASDVVADPTPDGADSVAEPEPPAAADAGAPADDSTGPSEQDVTTGDDGEIEYFDSRELGSLRRSAGTYTLSARANLDRYQVNLIAGPGMTDMIPDIVTAAEQIDATGLVALELNTTPQADHTSGLGEITIRVQTTPAACGDTGWGTWLGCAHQDIRSRYDGGGVAVGGAVSLPSYLAERNHGIRTSTILHELLHAIGLGHSGAGQIMAPAVDPAVTTLRSGDLAGMAALAAARQPALGGLEAVRGGIGTVTVAGWALDGDLGTNPATIDVLIDGAPSGAYAAAAARDDIAAAYGIGANHGYSITLSAPAGAHQVCVRIRRWLGGTNPVIGCASTTVEANHAPIGSIDAVRATSTTSLQVVGWALDPNTSASITTRLYVDGQLTATKSATESRQDVAAAYGKGAAHGFTFTTKVPSGQHELCIRALDTTSRRETVIGCTPSSANLLPIGSLDAVTSRLAGTIQVAGWALDPDTTDPIAVHIYLDGTAVAWPTADLKRSDVASAYNMGAAHGYSHNLTGIAAGTHEVCTWAIDPRGGGNPKLGCAQVTVLDNTVPVGSLDAVTSRLAGTIQVAGWALDPDTTDPIAVHIYLDGTAVAWPTADLKRSDVASAYNMGAAHGYSHNLTGIAAGTHEVCTWAIDASGGANPRLGCATVTVKPNAQPIGSIDAVTAATVDGQRRVSVTGWALDPDATDSISVSVEVDGVVAASAQAKLARQDVAAAYGKGANHGYNLTVTPTAGTHTYCVRAIDLQGESAPQIACRTF